MSARGEVEKKVRKETMSAGVPRRWRCRRRGKGADRSGPVPSAPKLLKRGSRSSSVPEKRSTKAQSASSSSSVVSRSERRLPSDAQSSDTHRGSSEWPAVRDYDVEKDFEGDELVPRQSSGETRVGSLKSLRPSKS